LDLPLHYKHWYACMFETNAKNEGCMLYVGSTPLTDEVGSTATL
jgi:hypothetical protein